MTCSLNAPLVSALEVILSQDEYLELLTNYTRTVRKTNERRLAFIGLLSEPKRVLWIFLVSPSSFPLILSGLIEEVSLKISVSSARTGIPLSTIRRRPEMVLIPMQMWYHTWGTIGELLRTYRHSSFLSLRNKCKLKIESQ